MCGFFVEGIELIIRTTMQCWWTDNQEAMLEKLAHPAQSLLDLQGGQRKIAEKMVNGPNPCDAAPMIPREEERHASIWLFKVT